MTPRRLLHQSVMVEQSTEGGGGTTAGGEDFELGLRCAQLQFGSSYMV
jgi:hypothetical protein